MPWNASRRAPRCVGAAARIPAKPRRMRACRASAAIIPWNATPGAAASTRDESRQAPCAADRPMTMLQDAPVLVTGCAGFIGMHTALALLARGRRVTGVDNLDSYYDVALKEARLARLTGLPGFRFARIDLAAADSAAALFRDGAFGQVVHLAAQPGVRYSLVNPGAYFANNLTAFGHVIEGCRHAKVAHLVYASSSSVYGANHELPFSEDQNVDHPVSLYAATKKANELIAHSYSHLYRLPDDGAAFLHGLRAVGPSRHGADAVHQGDPRRPPDPRVQQREDAPRFHVCRRHRRRHRAGAGPAAKGRRRRRAVRDLQHRQSRGRRVGDRSSPHSSGCWGGPRSGTMRRCNRATLPATYAAIDRLAALTGFAPQTPLADGLARFVAWYREYYST